MGDSTECCAVCGHEPNEGRTALSRVIIEGRVLRLCRVHAATVVAALPETFEDLRALFVGAGDAPENVPIERRSPVARRSEDRRVFPPRPEGRRASAGRRATDPHD